MALDFWLLASGWPSLAEDHELFHRLVLCFNSTFLFSGRLIAGSVKASTHTYQHTYIADYLCVATESKSSRSNVPKINVLELRHSQKLEGEFVTVVKFFCSDQ